MAKSPQRAMAFVDWDKARRLVKTDDRRGRADRKQPAFFALQERLAGCLDRLIPNTYYRIIFRLYHGWYRGKTKSQDRLEFEKQL